MTSFICDVSDYQGTGGINVPNLKNNGIAGLTSKVGEGGVSDNVHWSFVNNMNNAKAAGMTMYGVYYVVRSNTGPSVQAQVNDCVSLLDQNIGWWKNDPRFVIQCDLEDWGYDYPSWNYGVSFCDGIKASVPAKAGKIFLYASEGHYGNTSSYYAWNANYFSDIPGNYMDLYFNDAGGDGSYAYYGNKYQFLQYTQRGSVGNGYNGDVSAFRGSVQDLEKLIGAVTPTQSGADIM